MKKAILLAAVLLVAMTVSASVSTPEPAGTETQTSLQESALPAVAEAEEIPLKEEVLLAYYGHPNSRYMGIVGRHTLPELVEKVKATAREYQAVMPESAVVPAIYLIYGTVQPEGRIGFMSEEMVNRYINYAGEQGVRIILDHQIGRFTLKETMDRILPFLVHPHVHLAVDFEWRTSRPMQEIGFVRGEELTWMQQYMSEYLVRNNLPATRYLIFHQFKAAMVRNHAGIQTGFPQVELVHSTSGWGPPGLKRDTHAYNASITQIPTKAFKLWYYYSDKPGIHYDNPLMTPAEVAALKPRPRIIIYQ